MLLCLQTSLCVSAPVSLYSCTVLIKSLGIWFTVAVSTVFAPVRATYPPRRGRILSRLCQPCDMVANHLPGPTRRQDCLGKRSMAEARDLQGLDVLAFRVGREIWHGSIRTSTVSATDEKVTALIDWFDGSSIETVVLAGRGSASAALSRKNLGLRRGHGVRGL